MEEKEAIHGASINDGRVLMVKVGGYYVFPGGRIKGQELPEVTLSREVGEELSDTTIKMGKYYGTFSGPMLLGNWSLKSHVYFFEIEGELGKPSSEITSRKYVNSKNLGELKLTEVSKKTLVSLINGGFID